MKITRRHFLTAAGTSIMAAQLPLSARVMAEAKAGLKDAYKDRFFIGAAINSSIATNQHPDLTEIIKRDFSSVTPENSLKWEALRTEDGGWKWNHADAFVNFAQQHKLQAVGHCLAWHSQTPDSVFKQKNGDYIKPAELTKKIEEHVTTLVSRYKGKIAAWDAVNEAVGDDKQMRKSHYYNILGEEFIDKVFHTAHETDPNVHLIYNDYNNEHADKRDTTVELIKRLQKRKVPIHGLGMQLHLSLGGPSVEEIEKSIVAFHNLGLRVHVTELDVDILPSVWDIPVAEISTRFEYKPERDPYIKGLPKEIDQQLAKRYEDLFKLFIKHKDKIDRVTFWGLTDDMTWLNNFPVKGRTNYPLLFDRQHKPKEAYYKILAL